MSTISQWTVTYLMHSTLLIAGVAIAAHVLRSASVRDTLWKLALLGAFVTASVQTLVPAPRTVEIEPQAIESTSHRVFEGNLVDSKTRRLEDSSLPLLPIAYGAVAAFLLARIVVGRRRFLAQIANRVELVPTPELAAHRVRLTESRAIGSPVAMLGREIVLPAGISFTAEQRETILAHELAHVLRRDPLWLTMAEVVKALFFFQPLHWIVAAKMKETAEFLCDDAAVLRTRNPKALAETLAELAAHAEPASPAVAGMAENGSNLIARVKRVLRSHPRLPLALRTRIAIAVTVIGATVLFAPGFGIARTPRDVKFNDFSDATLSQTFAGPEGQTQVRFAAHEAAIALDGSTVRFHKSDGFIRATMRSDAGTRIIEVTPGPDLTPRYLYTFNGERRPWDDDARRTMIAGFRAEETFAGRGGRKWVSWGGHVELTGHTDHVPTYVSIDIRNIRYDEQTYELDLSQANSGLDVLERIGGRERTFTLREDGGRYTGRWDSAETQQEWLRRMLIEKVKTKPRVVEAVVRY